MTVYDIRAAVKSRYNNRTWHTRVDRMPDKRVIAIYYRMLRSGELHPAEPSAQIEMSF